MQGVASILNAASVWAMVTLPTGDWQVRVRAPPRPPLSLLVTLANWSQAVRGHAARRIALSWDISRAFFALSFHYLSCSDGQSLLRSHFLLSEGSQSNLSLHAVIREPIHGASIVTREQTVWWALGASCTTIQAQKCCKCSGVYIRSRSMGRMAVQFAVPQKSGVVESLSPVFLCNTRPDTSTDAIERKLCVFSAAFRAVCNKGGR